MRADGWWCSRESSVGPLQRRARDHRGSGAIRQAASGRVGPAALDDAAPFSERRDNARPSRAKNHGRADEPGELGTPGSTQLVSDAE